MQKYTFSFFYLFFLTGTFSGLRQFWATKSPLKMMKNDFSFTLKALFVLKISKFLYRLFGHVEKRFDQKDTVNFKIYDVTTWEHKQLEYTYCQIFQEVKAIRQ